MTISNSNPHRLNVPGDFYVEDGCCTACLVPIEFVPELLKYDDAVDHCYVHRQPSNADEEQKMVEAIRLSEVRCIRYRGMDAEILRSLKRAGEERQCDVPPTHVALAEPHARALRPKSRVWWLWWKK